MSLLYIVWLPDQMLLNVSGSESDFQRFLRNYKGHATYIRTFGIQRTDHGYIFQSFKEDKQAIAHALVKTNLTALNLSNIACTES